MIFSTTFYVGPEFLISLIRNYGKQYDIRVVQVS